MCPQLPFLAEETNKKLPTRSLLGLFPLILLMSADLSADILPGPDNYDQCVLESRKGITDNKDAETAKRACREKFPDTKFQDVELVPEALGKLIIHAGFGYGIFSGTIYNGNSDYTVTQITILLAPMKRKEAAGTFVDDKQYKIDLSLQPFTKGALSMPITSDNTLEYSWKLITARGYKTP
ncbi:MAG: hypothetical protein H0U72_01445 [Nitrosospira sp.]|nr:hypothetical protein [Nitrosospira sp.]